MNSSNNKVSNILDANHWSDALLIKDEKGNLAPLKPNLKILKDDYKINHVSEGALAPEDDVFMDTQTIVGNSQDKSELVFHPSDKEELDFFAKNIPEDDSKQYSIEKIVERIIEKQSLDLDEKNKKIFSKLLYNFFRNRKSATIIRELLTNNVLIKNKKLDASTVDIILSVVKGIKNKIDLAGGLVVNQIEIKAKEALLLNKNKNNNLNTDDTKKDKELSAQDEIKAVLGNLPIIDKKIDAEVELKSDNKFDVIKTLKPDKGFSIPSTSEKIVKKTAEGPERKSGVIKEALPAKPLVKAMTNELKDDGVVSIVELKKEVVDNQTKQEETIRALPKVSRGNVNQIPKKIISDVNISLKDSKEVNVEARSILTGPVQELQSFDLVGFRRLGETPKERIEKIFDKINLLAEDSYTKKAQGIAAWRSSAAYKLYLKLGVDSMVAGKDIASFIAEYESKNKDTFTTEEFSAISDLNKQLRF